MKLLDDKTLIEIGLNMRTEPSERTRRSKSDWEINNIDPNVDMWFSEIEANVGITSVTLHNWRRAGRLQVYENQLLTRGDWLIEAIRIGEPLTPTETRNNNRKKYPLKEHARKAISMRLRDGSLIRQPCEECGSEEDIEAHHDDYSKPLEIRWLCRKHHLLAHGKTQRTPRAKQKARRKTETLIKLQKNIVRLRKDSGMIQAELAKRTNMAQSHISRIESGHAFEISLDTAVALAQAFDITIDELIQ